MNQSDQPTQEKRTTLADIRKQRRQSSIVIGVLGGIIIGASALMLVTGYEPARYQIFALGAAFGAGTIMVVSYVALNAAIKIAEFMGRGDDSLMVTRHFLYPWESLDDFLEGEVGKTGRHE